MDTSTCKACAHAYRKSIYQHDFNGHRMGTSPVALAFQQSDHDDLGRLYRWHSVCVFCLPLPLPLLLGLLPFLSLYPSTLQLLVAVKYKNWGLALQLSLALFSFVSLYPSMLGLLSVASNMTM